jgi:hypothetical protein
MARYSSINDSGITQIVKALEKANDKQEFIADTIVGFNPVLQSPIVYDIIDNAVVFMAGVASTLIDISDTVNGIKTGISDVLGFFTGRQLQEEENRRELIDALNNLGEGRGGPGPVPTNEAKDKKVPAWLMSLGGITAFGASLGMLSGFMGEMSKLLASSRGIIWKLRVRVRWLSGKGLKLFASMSEDFGKLTNNLQTMLENNRFTKPFANIVKYFRVTTEAGGGFLKFIGKILTKIKDGFIAFGKSFKWGAKLGGLLAKALKAIAWPITVIMGAYATIMGAIKGWKEGGLIGALEGGISGLLVNLVGEVVDLLKDAVSWVAKMLGFENFSKALDGFSFSELLDTGVKAIFGTIEYVWDYMVGLFSPDKLIASFEQGGFAGLAAMIGGGILDMVKGAVSWFATMIGDFEVANWLDNFSIQDYLVKGVKAMIDFVGVAIDAVIKWFEEAPAMINNAMKSVGDMASDFAKNILKSVLPDPSKHDSAIDPLHWVGKAIPKEVYQFAGMQTPEEYSNSLNAGTGGVNPYEQKAREIMAKEKNAADQKLMVEDYIRGVPSKAGSTLGEAGPGTTNAAPVIINNMGGNVTNNSSSNVNNNSSPFEPIISGSALGFSSF